MSGHHARHRGFDPLELELQMILSCHMGSLREQSVLLITELSIHPHTSFIWSH